MKAVYVSLALIGLGVTSMFYELSGNAKVYNYNITDFIQPSEKFLACDTADDCFKFRGSACPADMGGVETCVNKNFVQAYNSQIEESAGLYVVTDCPNVSFSTDMTCTCTNGRCMLSE